MRFFDDNNNPVLDESGNEIISSFDAKRCTCWRCTQTQYGISLRYEPNKVSYLKIRATYFDDYYSDFDPLSLNGSNQVEKVGRYLVINYLIYTLDIK